MPPSGFYDRHSVNIVRFFKSCVSDLIKENLGIRTPIEAIRREIAHIERDFQEVERSLVAKSLLHLTHAFYSEMLLVAPSNFDELDEIADIALDKIKHEIEAIKVAD